MIEKLVIVSLYLEVMAEGPIFLLLETAKTMAVRNHYTI